MHRPASTAGCILADIAVPDEVAIVGIDNDTLGQHLTRIQLSSVSQGTHQMGHTAAHLLHQMLGGARLGNTRIVVPPAGIQPRASSRREAAHGPQVMRALHYIRQYACQGIKTEQVASTWACPARRWRPISAANCSVPCTTKSCTTSWTGPALCCRKVNWPGQSWRSVRALARCST